MGWQDREAGGDKIMSQRKGSKGPSERAPLGKQRDAIKKEQHKRAALMRYIQKRPV